jgi:hypothetical protein
MIDGAHKSALDLDRVGKKYFSEHCPRVKSLKNCNL